jgi:hypothetical protein
MAIATMNMVSAGEFSGVSFHFRKCPQRVASVLCKKTPIFDSRRSKLDHLTVHLKTFELMSVPAAASACRAMFSSGFAETTAKQVELKETCLEAFKLLLTYIYSGRLAIPLIFEPSSNLLQHLLRLAHLYQLGAVVASVAERMSRTVTRGNVISYLELAELYGLKNLERSCWSWLDIDFCAPPCTPALTSVNEVRKDLRQQEIL